MLSFDVLGVIFAFYAETETITHPLETLLLVCRDWSNVVLGHRALWGRLRIYISHEPFSKVWGVRLPLRLARCGSDVPLDIDLRSGLAGGLDNTRGNGIDGFRSGDNDDEDDDVGDNALYPIFSCVHEQGREPPTLNLGYESEGGFCTCYPAARKFIKLTLQILMGINGEMCKQWRSFKVDFGYYATPGADYAEVLTQIGTALSFPTPNLVSLELRHVLGYKMLSGMNIFPDTSKLKKLVLFDSSLPSLPPCKNLRIISIRTTDSHMAQNLSSLREANRVQVLSLRCMANNIALPAKLEQLHTLRLGETVSQILAGCQMPNVSTLAIESKEDNLLAQVLTFNNIPFGELVDVTLKWDLSQMETLPTKEDLAKILNSVTDLLTRARNVRHIKADRFMMSMILRVLWNSVCTRPPRRYTPERMPPGKLFAVGTLTHLGHRDSITLTGNQNATVIKLLAALWQCGKPHADLVDLPLEQGLSEVFR